jgi:hypothetical protein
MIQKSPYAKPQSAIVWLPAPTVLVGASGVTNGASGTWEGLNPFGSFNSFVDNPFNNPQSPDNFLL